MRHSRSPLRGGNHVGGGDQGGDDKTESQQIGEGEESVRVAESGQGKGGGIHVVQTLPDDFAGTLSVIGHDLCGHGFAGCQRPACFAEFRRRQGTAA